MTTPTLDLLCSQLQKELASDPRGLRVTRLLEDYVRAGDDWRPYVAFSPVAYTRNLLHRCGQYELLLLCWKAGQESPIHDHMGQSCWMGVLDGRLEELHYRPPEGATGELIPGRVRSYGRGEVAFIEDSIAVHRIRPAGSGDGISLHLYARAIDECRIYDPETGVASLVSLGYHSVRGRLCGDQAPAVIRAEWS